jgi:hypothetical protein
LAWIIASYNVAVESLFSLDLIFALRACAAAVGGLADLVSRAGVSRLRKMTGGAAYLIEMVR